MAKTIDEKVVKLSLDNKDLQSKAQGSLSIIEKLKQKFAKADTLKTKDSIQSLDNLSNKANGVTMDVLKSAIDGVGNKFSAMGVIAATVISNITTKVMGLASTLARSLTVQPMIDGFQEYELKIGSIQTILANTARHGTGLEEVTANLDELNTYADKTIYNFGDMTRNIGLFTNAGIKVGDATQMIKGFSNEAATSGTNAQQAAGAAYQLSQALSAGTIRLMDWRSLQNVGMGNKNMQMGLIELTEAMGKFEGTGTDAAAVQKDFNGSLEKGWLSADIMSTYLQIMAEEDANVNREKMKAIGLNDKQIEQFIKQQATAQDAATKVRTFSQLIDTAQEALGSGWTETMELIFGDFNEATELWTSLNNVIDPIIAKQADARNNFIKGLNEMGARKVVIEALGNVFKALGQVMSTIGDAWSKVFPPASKLDVMAMIMNFKYFTQTLLMSKSTMSQVGTIFQGVFSVISIGIKVVKMIGKAFLNMLPDSLGGDFLDLLEGIAKYIIGIDKALTPTSKFADILKTLSGGLKSVLTFILNIGKNIVGAFSGLGKMLPKLGDIFGGLGKGIGKSLSGIKVDDLLNASFIVTLIALSKKIGGIIDKIVDGFSSFGEIGDAINKGIENLAGLTDVLDTMNRVVNVASIVAISGSILMIAGALSIISKINAQDIFKSLEVLALSLAGVMGVLWVISKKNLTGSFKAAFTIQAIAFALIEMGIALKILSTIDPQRMGSSLLGLAGALTIVVVAMKVMSKLSGSMIKSALSITIIAGALIVLSGAVAIFGNMDLSTLQKGIISLGLVMLELAIFVKVVNSTKLNPATAVSVGIIAGSVMVMAGAVYVLGSMDVGALTKGLVTIGLILAGFAILSKVIGSGASFLGAAASMLILSVAINALIIPLKQFGGMSYDEITKGLITLAGGLLIMVGALNMAKGTLAGSAALIAASFAIAMFTPAILALSQLSWGQLAVGLVAIAGTFAIVAAAALLLGPASVALIPFALGIAAVGLAIGAVGVVILAATTALTTLAALTVTGIASIIVSLGLLVAGLTMLIPQFIDFGVQAFLGLLSGLQQVVPQLITTVMQLILSLLTAIRDYVPQFLVLGMEILTNLLNGFADNVGELIDAGTRAVIELINGMANSVRDNQEAFVGAIKNLIGSILELLVTGFEEIIVTMFGWIPGVEKIAGDVGDAARKGLKEKFGPEQTAEDAKAGADGYNQALAGKAGEANAAGSTVAQAGKDGLGSKTAVSEGDALAASAALGIAGQGGKAYSSGSATATKGKQGLGSKNARNEGEALGGGFNSGVSSKGGAANTAGSTVAGQAASGLGSKAGESNGLGVDLAQGFINGIGSLAGAAWDAASNLVDKALSAIKSKQKSASPSKETHKLGVDFKDGYNNALIDGASDVYNSAKGLARSALDGASNVLSNEAAKIAQIIDLQPVIKPILDLSNISRARLGTLAIEGGQGGQITNNYDVTINAPENDARKIAKEVERIIVRG